MNKKIIVATGQEIINSVIQRFEDYTVVGTINSRDELYIKCQEYQADILLVGEGLFGSIPLIKPLLEITRQLPNTRIIYLTGDLDFKDENKINSLALLIMAGVYDIIHEKKMTVSMLKSVLDNPKLEKDIDYIVKASNKLTLTRDKENKIEFIVPEEYKEENDEIKDNLHVISSIKPGTGKSFLSVNIAAAIAQYGVNTNEGKRPRVGLIEADLQNLSLGTLLQIEDDSKNLKTVMEKIKTIITDDGDCIGDSKQIEEVNDYIKDCFMPYCKIKNLKALVGSQLSLEELENIISYHYIYLVDAVVDNFDVLIVDSNSALTHVTTYPLLRMAKNCYYVLNLDFNNIRNNMKYKETLKEIGILDKVKYVLNEDISNEEEKDHDGTSIEKLMFNSSHLEDSNFKLEAKIPVIPKTIFLNRVFEGTPIVLNDKIKEENVIKAKFELLKIANQIYPIKDFSEIEEKVQNQKKKKRVKIFK